DRTRPFVLVLIEVESVEHPLVPWAHLGVGCESREEVERLCGEARAEGRLLTGPTDSGYPVGYWALLRDPDGHTLELSFGQEVGLTVERGDSGQSHPR
ncbi:MAG TPA: VOC family protein, partial [Pyrinomonadaceae bacterium]